MYAFLMITHVLMGVHSPTPTVKILSILKIKQKHTIIYLLLTTRPKNVRVGYAGTIFGSKP